MDQTPASGAGNGTSTRPYLIRALHDWCTDNGFTPYIAVHVDRSVQVPMEYVSNNEIVLNIGFDATSGLDLGNEFVQFKARFGDTNSFGAPTFVAVQAIAMGISAACADNRISRAEVRRTIGNVRMSTSLLGAPIRFAKSGDVVGGVGFTIFQIGNDGTYNVAQKG